MRPTMFSTALAATLALVVAALPAAAQKQGGTVVIAQGQQPPSLDPHVTSAQAARNINLHVYETLVARDENAKTVPDLAEKVDISADGLTYTFTLRQGVPFHNGKVMTAADAAASLERYRKVGASANVLATVDTITASGPNTLVIKLKQVTPALLDSISSPRAPMAIMPAEEAAKPAGQTTPIGTGPFRFVEYVPDSHVKLEKFKDYKPNPAYRDRDGFAGHKVVHLDAVTFRFIAESGARAAGLQSGEIQLLETIDGPAAKRLQADRAYTVYPVLPFAFQVIKMNNNWGPTADANLRRAIYVALDMEEIMAISFPDIYQLEHGWQYPTSEFFAGDVGSEFYNKKDLNKAKEFLSKSSYKGEKLLFIVDNGRSNVDTATIVQQQLAKIGINVEISVADWPTVSTLGFKPEGWNFWAHGFGIEPFEGPFSVMQPWVGAKASQAKPDPVLEQLWTRMNSSLDVAERKKIFADFQARLVSEAIVIKAGNYGIFQTATAKLKNFKPYRIPRMWGTWLE